jgi:hypothetical protein
MGKDVIDFFILGYARSGTSLLRMILNGHPSIKVNPECSFVSFFYEEYKFAKFPLSQFEERRFVDRIVNSRKFHTWNLNSSTILAAIKEQAPSDYGQLCSIIYQLHNPGKQFKYLGDKNNINIFHRKILEEIYPVSKFVYIVRDPRDVYCSLLSTQASNIGSQYAPSLQNNIFDYCNHWMEAYSEVAKHFPLNNPRDLFIRYEDLVKLPEITITKVLEFINPNLSTIVSESDLNILHLIGNDEPEEMLKWKEKTLHPISIESVGRWSRELSQHDARQISNLTQEFLKIFEYES